MLFMLHDQEVNRVLREKDSAYGVVRFRHGYDKFTTVAGNLLIHRQKPSLNVQIRPQQGQELPPTKAAGQFQVEHFIEAQASGSLQIRPDFVVREHLHLSLFLLGHFTVVAWIERDQVFFHCVLESSAQDQMSMFDGTCRKRLIGGLPVAVEPTTLLHLIVEGLDLNGGEPGQLDISKSWDKGSK